MSTIHPFFFPGHPHRLRVEVEFYAADHVHLHPLNDNPNQETPPTVVISFEERAPEEKRWELQIVGRGVDTSTNHGQRKDAINAAIGHCEQHLSTLAYAKITREELAELTAYLERTLVQPEPSPILPTSRCLRPCEPGALEHELELVS